MEIFSGVARALSSFIITKARRVSRSLTLSLFFLRWYFVALVVPFTLSQFGWVEWNTRGKSEIANETDEIN